MGVMLDGLAEGLQAALFTISQSLGGSLAAAIITATLAVRLAMLPLTYRLALRARRQARRLAKLRPQLERLRERWSGDPRRLGEATMRLYRARGVRPLDPAVLGGALLQVRIVATFYRAIRGLGGAARGQRFLWVRDLAAPDLGLALAAAALMAWTMSLAGPEATGQAGWLRALLALTTLAVLLFMSSAFGLYATTSGAVSVLQQMLVRRTERRLREGG